MTQPDLEPQYSAWRIETESVPGQSVWRLINYAPIDYKVVELPIDKSQAELSIRGDEDTIKAIYALLVERGYLWDIGGQHGNTAE